jgi:hypothetical protein
MKTAMERGKLVRDLYRDQAALERSTVQYQSIREKRRSEMSGDLSSAFGRADLMLEYAREETKNLLNAWCE